MARTPRALHPRGQVAGALAVFRKSKIPHDEIHVNPVLPGVVGAPISAHTLIVVRDPIAGLNTAFDQ